MGKTRDFFKKIRDTKGTAGHNKGQKLYGPNRNGRDQKRWQEHPEELYKKGLNDQITTMVGSLTRKQTPWSVKSSGP